MKSTAFQKSGDFAWSSMTTSAGDSVLRGDEPWLAPRVTVTVSRFASASGWVIVPGLTCFVGVMLMTPPVSTVVASATSPVLVPGLVTGS